MKNLDPSTPHSTLPCSISPIKPELNFGFRFQTGYLLRLPLNLYHGPGHRWYIVFRVTPEGGNREPVYYLDTIDLPPVLRPEFVADVLGLFLVGKGNYEVTWSLLDDLGRVCRESWSVEARLDRSQRSVQMAIPPNTSGDLSWHPISRDSAKAHPLQLTVLLNAALPSRPGAFGKHGGFVYNQWGSLLGMLSSLLESLPAARVQLIVFNLDQQRELLRLNPFTLEGMQRVSHAANGTDQWSVDYRVLQHPTGAWDLLEQLVNQELYAAEPADAVIFLGVPWGSREKMPAGFPEPAARRFSRMFYLQYRSAPPRRSAVGWETGPDPRNLRLENPEPIAPGVASEPFDSIEQTVRRFKGKTYQIYSPTDFSKAIQQIERPH